MPFFKQFPKTTYDLKRDGQLIEIRNMFRNVDVNERLIDPASSYQFYEIKDGERPDLVSSKLYRSSNYYWTFFVTNDHLKDGLQAWPLSYQQLQRKIQKYYAPYVVLELIPESFRKINQYSNDITNLYLKGVGDDATTRTGRVYKVDNQRNQVWISDASTNLKNFAANNQSSFTQSGITCKGGSYSIHLRENNDPAGAIIDTGDDTYYAREAFAAAWQAPVYYKDGSGNKITIYDALTTGATTNPTTWSEELESENDKLRNIRVIKPEFISEFVEQYKELIQS